MRYSKNSPPAPHPAASQHTSPSGFVFTPTNGSLQCAAFSVPFKLLAITIVTLATLWAWHMWTKGLIEPTLQSSGWLAAALAMMAYTEWHILTGKTSLDHQALQQTWVWRKRVIINELAYVKLFRVKGLDWLIAPRLYTRTYSNKLSVFYAASPAMLAEFARLESSLASVRHGA